MLKDVIIDRLKTVDGITYSYDSVRLKWLSIGRCHISYGINHRNINTSRWLAVTQGIYSNNIGFKIAKKGTITTIIIQAKNTALCKFIIMEGNKAILTLELDNEADKTINTLDMNFGEGASLGCYLEIKDDNIINYPFVVLECASRLD